MNELEELKRKKLLELQEQAKEQIETQQKLGMIDAYVKRYLTREAIQRLGAIKSVDQEKAIKIMIILAQAIESGQIKEKITDEMLKNILMHFQEKKDFKIRR